MTDQPTCRICNKPKPPEGFAPFSRECDAGYTEQLRNGKRVPGYCDSVRQGIPWPPIEWDW